MPYYQLCASAPGGYREIRASELQAMLEREKPTKPSKHYSVTQTEASNLCYCGAVWCYCPKEVERTYTYLKSAATYQLELQRFKSELASEHVFFVPSVEELKCYARLALQTCQVRCDEGLQALCNKVTQAASYLEIKQILCQHYNSIAVSHTSTFLPLFNKSEGKLLGAIKDFLRQRMGIILSYTKDMGYAEQLVSPDRFPEQAIAAEILNKIMQQEAAHATVSAAAVSVAGAASASLQ